MNLLSIVKGASLVFVCRVAGAILTFASQVLLARWMSAEELGVYVFAFAIAILVKTVSGLGLSSAAIRFASAAVAKNRSDLLRGYVRRGAQSSALTGVLVTAVGVSIVSTMPALPNAQRMALIAALLIAPIAVQLDFRASVALGLSWIPEGMLPGTVARPLLFFALISVAWSLAVPLNSGTAMALHLAAFAAVTLVHALVMRARLATRFPGAEYSYETSLWVRTAAPLLLISVFAVYFLELNLFIAGLFLESADLAVFSVSFRIAALIAFGVFAVDTVAMPQISKSFAADDKTTFKATIVRASRLRLLGALACSVGLLFFGRTILWLFGEVFVEGYQTLLILGLAQVVGAAFGPTARILSVTGMQMHCLKIFAVSLAVMMALHPLFISLLGTEGAALSVLVTVALQSTWLFIDVRRLLGVRAWAFST